MIVTTTENVPGHNVTAVLGQVFGVVVRSRGLGGNITASLRSIVGGEIPEYTKLVEDARRHATDRTGPERDRDGRQRGRHDALRFGRDRAIDERSRRLRHRGGARPRAMMLRNVVLAITLGWLAIGASAALMLGAGRCSIFPAIVAAGSCSSASTIRAMRAMPRPATGARPTSGSSTTKPGGPVVVWFNPTTGERKYVED